MLTRLDSKLQGLGENTLTAVMLAAAGFLVIAALTARPSVKLAIAIWVLAP